MTKFKKKAHIVGAYEHPGRKLPGYTVERLYLEIMAGALSSAGLITNDIDGLMVSTVPGQPPAMAEALGLTPVSYTHLDVYKRQSQE